MADLRLYKDFYCIENSPSLTADTYTLFDVSSLSVEVKERGDTTVVESPNSQNESTGIYFISLNQYAYQIDKIYEAFWTVQYVSGAPVKILKSRFKIYATFVGSEIELRVDESPIELDIDNGGMTYTINSKQTSG